MTCTLHKDSSEPGTTYYWDCSYDFLYIWNAIMYNGSYSREYYQVPKNNMTVDVCLNSKGQIGDKGTYLAHAHYEYVIGGIITIVGIGCVVYSVIDLVTKHRDEYIRIV